MNINTERLLSYLNELSQKGKISGLQGIYRLAFSEGDLAGRAFFKEKINAAGLSEFTDGCGNIHAFYNPDKLDLPEVIIGSHIDSVPAAGHLDGSLGVMAGLECLISLKEQGLKPERPIRLIAFSDEEGRFGGTLGSMAIAGDLTPEMIESSKDLNGISLKQAMQAAGLNAKDCLQCRIHPDKIHCFLELHIEQGPVLDQLKIPIGIVEGIAGIMKWNVRFIGVSNHAGTTPMNLRQDAFLALSEFSLNIKKILDQSGSERSVATIGKVQLSPGTANTIPETASFSLDFRDTDPEILSALQKEFRKELSRIARENRIMFEFDVLSSIEPAKCDPDVISVIEETVKERNLNYKKMMSGAVHDTQVMAHITRTGMIFVPSCGGRSHSTAEWTHPEDLEAGANVLLHAILKLSGVKHD
ncbi:MAG: Zn-dependent hydrolase [Spirochaetia bacterium]|nr:Zn-dependent hydrolase [Spirochaetia bacterium]